LRNLQQTRSRNILIKCFIFAAILLEPRTTVLLTMDQAKKDSPHVLTLTGRRTKILDVPNQVTLLNWPEASSVGLQERRKQLRCRPLKQNIWRSLIVAAVLPRFWCRLDSRYIAFPWVSFTPLRLPSCFLDYLCVSIVSIAYIIMFIVYIFAHFSCSFAHVSLFVPFTSSHILWPSMAFLRILSHSLPSGFAQLV